MIQPYNMSSLFGDTGCRGVEKAQFIVPRALQGDLIIGQRHDGRVVLRGEIVFHLSCDEFKKRTAT